MERSCSSQICVNSQLFIFVHMYAISSTTLSIHSGLVYFLYSAHEKTFLHRNQAQDLQFKGKRHLASASFVDMCCLHNKTTWLVSASARKFKWRQKCEWEASICFTFFMRRKEAKYSTVQASELEWANMAHICPNGTRFPGIPSTWDHEKYLIVIDTLICSTPSLQVWTNYF